MPIKVTLDGKSWLTEDLTLDELATIEQELPVRVTIDPNSGQRLEARGSWQDAIWAPLQSAVGARAIVRRFLAREHGETEAVKRAGALTMPELLQVFEVVADDVPNVYKDGLPVVDPKAGEADQETT